MLKRLNGIPFRSFSPKSTLHKLSVEYTNSREIIFSLDELSDRKFKDLKFIAEEKYLAISFKKNGVSFEKKKKLHKDKFFYEFMMLEKEYLPFIVVKKPNRWFRTPKTQKVFGDYITITELLFNEKGSKTNSKIELGFVTWDTLLYLGNFGSPNDKNIQGESNIYSYLPKEDTELWYYSNAIPIYIRWANNRWNNPLPGQFKIPGRLDLDIVLNRNIPVPYYNKYYNTALMFPPTFKLSVGTENIDDYLQNNHQYKQISQKFLRRFLIEHFLRKDNFQIEYLEIDNDPDLKRIIINDKKTERMIKKIIRSNKKEIQYNLNFFKEFNMITKDGHVYWREISY
jgi:disulfide oxidoreductase YuzD